MSVLTKSILFASLAVLSLFGGVAIHAVQFRRGARTPVKVLRTFFSTGLICAAVAVLLFCDYLQRPDLF